MNRCFLRWYICSELHVEQNNPTQRTWMEPWNLSPTSRTFSLLSQEILKNTFLCVIPPSSVWIPWTLELDIDEVKVHVFFGIAHGSRPNFVSSVFLVTTLFYYVPRNQNQAIIKKTHGFSSPVLLSSHFMGLLQQNANVVVKILCHQEYFIIRKCSPAVSKPEYWWHKLL